MNFLLHKHQTENHVVHIPNGLNELLSDITREVLRIQPANICEYIANYLDAVLVAREDTAVAERTVASLIDCSMTIADLILANGISREKADKAARIIQKALREHNAENQGLPHDEIIPLDEKPILISLIDLCNFNENELRGIQDIINTAYKSFYYRQINFFKNVHKIPGIIWKDAVENTLNIYRKSIPDVPELQRAAVVIQSSYRGYYTRLMLAQKKNIEPHVIKIQSFYRGYKARLLVNYLRNEDKIVKIQSLYRGFRVRKDIDNEKKRKQQDAEKKQEYYMEHLDNIIQVQAIARGYITRKKLNDEDMHNKKSAHHLKHEKKIVQIQSAFRGYRTRKDIEKNNTTV